MLWCCDKGLEEMAMASRFKAKAGPALAVLGCGLLLPATLNLPLRLGLRLGFLEGQIETS